MLHHDWEDSGKFSMNSEWKHWFTCRRWFSRAHTPHTQTQVRRFCEIPTGLKSTTAGCLQNNKACVIFYPALFSHASSSRHSKSEHQITSDAGRERAPPTCRTDYLSRRPQFVRLKNRLSGALMRNAKNCNTESRPPARVLLWLWWSDCGQSG